MIIILNESACSSMKYQYHAATFKYKSVIRWKTYNIILPSGFNAWIAIFVIFIIVVLIELYHEVDQLQNMIKKTVIFYL